MDTTKQILYRPLCRRDRHILADIIGDVFDLDEYGGGKTVQDMLRQDYLLGCLKETNYTSVAIDSETGEPVGCILGRVDKAGVPIKRLLYLFEELYIDLLLLTSPRGRLYLKEQGAVSRTDRRLKGDHPYDGELVCFTVLPHLQGHGIGKHLLDGFREFAREKGAHKLYLYTDCFCNVDFYRTHNFREVAEADIMFQTEPGKKDPFYLFEFDV